MNLSFLILLLLHMQHPQYPHPPSHKTLQIEHLTFDSNFDSGNLFNAEKAGSNSFNIWIAADHPKNQYRTWFHFSVMGLNKGTLATFNIKNMQNQSKLLNEGLVPVYRQESSLEWKRIAHQIDLNKIEHNQGWIEWSFKHSVTSQDKIFFAFFYPWSNTENDRFLQQIQQKCQKQEDLYFKRSTIIKSLEGRPVQFITISSRKGITQKPQKFEDQHLFANHSQPLEFTQQKCGIVIGARVHPGEVPSSHVMTGIISQLTQNSQKAKILRDRFVFYLFPIFNPDGVARGHYRADPNGINLNRCYINPSPKLHSPIYAVRRVIMHLHKKDRYFGFLDLHAHAARKGVFIYGNSTNQLQKQVQICLFPKILSMNSQIFEYEGSNFTQKNMYCKDRNDHISKQGAGRVALFKATKNPYSWTLQCNYNTSRVINVLEEKKQIEHILIRPNQKQLDAQLLINYKYPTVCEPKYFYTIQHFRRLGKQICESFLDLIQLNPQSRIDNPNSHFKSVQNLKMNLAIALMRMAPSRFQTQYRKIYHYLQGPAASKQLTMRGLKALYFLIIKKAKINNLNDFIKQGDLTSLVLPQILPKAKIVTQIRIKQYSSDHVKTAQTQSSRQNIPNQQNNQQKQQNYDKSQNNQRYQQQTSIYLFANNFTSQQNQNNQQTIKHQTQINSQFVGQEVVQISMSNHIQPGFLKQVEVGSEGVRVYRKSNNSRLRFSTGDRGINQKISLAAKELCLGRSKLKDLPELSIGRNKAISKLTALSNQIKNMKKGENNNKQPTIIYF